MKIRLQRKISKTKSKNNHLESILNELHLQREKEKKWKELLELSEVNQSMGE